jgi:hypothetical protein
MKASLRLQLEAEAWRLVCELSQRIESEMAGHYVLYPDPILRIRLYHVHARAYARFLRRQAFLYD